MTVLRHAALAFGFARAGTIPRDVTPLASGELGFMTVLRHTATRLRLVASGHDPRLLPQSPSVS
jgi:hypothetical protein